jgi:hypothetical protein
MKQKYQTPPKLQNPPPNMDLLTQMAKAAYAEPTPLIDEEEQLRKLWEDMARKLDSSQLRVASLNYRVWCARQRERKNQTA